MSISPFSAAADRKDCDGDRFVPESSSVTGAAVGSSARDGSSQGKDLARGLSLAEDGALILSEKSRASRGNGSAGEDSRPKLQFGSEVLVCQGQQDDDSPGTKAVWAELNNLLSADDSGDFAAVASFASPMKIAGDDDLYPLCTPIVDAASSSSIEAGISGLSIGLESQVTSDGLTTNMANLNIKDSGGAAGSIKPGIFSAIANGSASIGIDVGEGGQSNLLDEDSPMTKALLAACGDLSGDSASWTPPRSVDIGFGTDFFLDGSPGIGSPGTGKALQNNGNAAAALVSSPSQQPGVTSQSNTGSPSSMEATSDPLLTVPAVDDPSSVPFESASKGGEYGYEGSLYSSPGKTSNETAHGHYIGTGQGIGWKCPRDDDSQSTDSSASGEQENRGDNDISLGTASLLTRDLASPAQVPSVSRVPCEADANGLVIVDAGIDRMGGGGAAEDEDSYPEMPPLSSATTDGAARTLHQIPPSLSSNVLDSSGYYFNFDIHESTEPGVAAAAASSDSVIGSDDENFLFDVEAGADDGLSESDAFLAAAGSGGTGRDVYDHLKTTHAYPLSSIIPLNDLNSKMQAAAQLLEVFVVEGDDIKEYSAGNKGVTHHQVGLRCTYCTKNDDEKGRGYFVLLSGIDQVKPLTNNFVTRHFSKHCKGVSDEAKKILTGKAVGKSIGKPAWTKCFEDLQIFEPVHILGKSIR